MIGREMMIFIPTLGRHNTPGTVDRLPPHWLFRTWLVVQPQECAAYERVARRSGAKLLILPAGMQGIASARLFIAKTAHDWGVAKMCQLDDDLRFYYRPNPRDHHMKPAAPDDVGRMLDAIETDLDVYAHVGVSDRNGNNNVPEEFVRTVRYCRVLAYQVEPYLALEHGRVEEYEDFDANLQLLKRGRDCKVWYRWAQQHDRTNAPGGCSVWRTRETHERAARDLAGYHPGLVKLRLKTYVTCGGFGDRVEVIVSWKQALANKGTPVIGQPDLFMSFEDGAA
jgi:hypothetical protein